MKKCSRSFVVKYRAKRKEESYSARIQTRAHERGLNFRAKREREKREEKNSPKKVHAHVFRVYLLP